MTLHEYRYFDSIMNAFVTFDSMKEAITAYKEAKENEIYVGQIKPLEERVVSTWRVIADELPK